MALLDEQEVAGDPASGHGGEVIYPYMPGYQQWEYQGSYGTGGQGLQALIDLRSPRLLLAAAVPNADESSAVVPADIDC